MPNNKKPILDTFIETIQRKYQELKNYGNTAKKQLSTAKAGAVTVKEEVTKPKSPVNLKDMLKSKSIFGSKLSKKMAEVGK